MLEMLRNKGVVFAGDLIGRNQWESLFCLLSAASNKSSIYEADGNPIMKLSGFSVFMFEDLIALSSTTDHHFWSYRVD